MIKILQYLIIATCLFFTLTILPREIQRTDMFRGLGYGLLLLGMLTALAIQWVCLGIVFIKELITKEIRFVEIILVMTSVEVYMSLYALTMINEPNHNLSLISIAAYWIFILSNTFLLHKSS